MDKGTFERIRDLRSQAAKVASEHEPAEQEHNGATPEQRFKGLGKLVMERDDFPSDKKYGGKKFTVTAFLPDSVTVRLVAETSMLADDRRPTVDDLVTVSAEWMNTGASNPMHVDSVGNISDSHPPSPYNLKELAGVEESFATARPHISV